MNARVLRCVPLVCPTRSQAAEALGISRSTCVRRMLPYGLRPASVEAPRVARGCGGREGKRLRIAALKQLNVLPSDTAAAASIRSLLGESEAATRAEAIAWAFGSRRGCSRRH